MNSEIELNRDVFKIDAGRWCDEIESFIKQKLADSYREGIAVTVSGGLDSSVAAALCTAAVGKDKVEGLMLPEKWGNPQADYYGKMIARHLGIKVHKINISPILRGLGTGDLLLAFTGGREFWADSVKKYMRNSGHSTKGDYLEYLKGELNPQRRRMIAKVSSRQRARLLAAYKFAEEKNYLVVGSSHKTERMVGLFCKYGIDDCANALYLP